MNSIDQLLSRALLLKDPHVPADVVPYNTPYEDDPCCPCADTAAAGGLRPPPDPEAELDPILDGAAADLQLLCETVVTHTAATSLNDLVTETLPAPSGARLVGCILLLVDDEDSARFWWQYAAGAGDDPASYCLYLHHLSHGDIYAADWWLQQASHATKPGTQTILVPGGTRAADSLDIDPDLITVLRVLSRLTDPDTPHRRTELVSAVMDYVAGAVATGCATNPEAQIPLPKDFAEHLDLILAAAAATDTGSCTPRPRRSRVLVGEWLNP